MYSQIWALLNHAILWSIPIVIIIWIRLLQKRIETMEAVIRNLENQIQLIEKKNTQSSKE